MGMNLFEQCEMEQFYVDAEMAVKDTENAPRTCKQAMSCGEKAKWIAAIIAELKQLCNEQTWTILKNNGVPNLSKSKWVLKKKIESDGSIRCKARLAVKGCAQKEGVDHFNTFAPTTCPSMV